ncbi:hypothetical protein LCGC14_2935150, partial [marine sediment metagenome]
MARKTLGRKRRVGNEPSVGSRRTPLTGRGATLVFLPINQRY